MLDVHPPELRCRRGSEQCVFPSPLPSPLEADSTLFSPAPVDLPFTNGHNARSAHLTFHIPRAGICHGFAGYFEAVLYADVTLSIHPERAAGDMLSWFPIFFPLSVRSSLNSPS
jgi:hypothetical protein